MTLAAHPLQLIDIEICGLDDNRDEPEPRPRRYQPIIHRPRFSAFGVTSWRAEHEPFWLGCRPNRINRVVPRDRATDEFAAVRQWSEHRRSRQTSAQAWYRPECDDLGSTEAVGLSRSRARRERPRKIECSPPRELISHSVHVSEA